MKPFSRRNKNPADQDSNTVESPLDASHTHFI
jgi:hypothetical protein